MVLLNQKVKGDSNMWLLTAIAPVLIVGGIVLYVVGRLKHKYNNGTLGKKKSKTLKFY